MISIAYANDAISVYDYLFLKTLVKRYNVFLLTFNPYPKHVHPKVNIVKIFEPFAPDRGLLSSLKYIRILPHYLRPFLLKSYINILQPDLLIGCIATGYGFYSALSNYKPFILFIWGSDVLVAPKRFLPRFYAKYSLAKADAVLVDSKVQRDAAVRLGCDPNKIICFPWFNPEDVSQYLKEDRDALRERLGWKDNIIIVSSRSHEPIYNVECLLEAAPMVIKQNAKCRFLILGGGSLTNYLKRRVLELGIDKYVKFTGYVPRNVIINYINASDIYVSTSLSDGTSSSLLEAMACKLPAVVTDIQGNREWIVEGQNGILFPCKDFKSLANKLLYLIENKRLREKLGDKAFNTVMSRADWYKSSEKLYEIIEKLAKKGAN